MRYLLVSLCTLLIATQSMGATSPVVGIRLSFDAATLDWNHGDVPIHVINNVVEGLYAVNGKGQLVPREAVSLPKLILKSATSSVWRVTLRKDLKWSDGVPVTAQHYVDSWNRLLDKKTASTYAYLLFDIQSSRAISATELEFEVKKKTFSPSVFTHWATYPIRADLIEKYGPQWATDINQMVFNGPYKITAHQKEIKFTLKPNTKHRTPGRLPEIEALIITEDTTALKLYESGRIHFMADLASLDRKVITKRHDFHSIPSQVLVYIATSPALPPVDNKQTRQALNAAIPRAHIPKVLGASHEPTETIIPQKLAHKLQLPKMKLSKTTSANIGVQTRLDFFQKGTNSVLCELLQAEWKKQLGAKIELQGSEVKSYWARLRQNPVPLFLNTYGAPVWEAKYYFNLFRSDNSANLTRWKNEQYDKAVDEQNWIQAARILAEEAPVFPLYFRSYDYLVNPALKGAVVNPMTSLDLTNASLVVGP